MFSRPLHGITPWPYCLPGSFLNRYCNSYLKTGACTIYVALGVLLPLMFLDNGIVGKGGRYCTYRCGAKALVVYSITGSVLLFGDLNTLKIIGIAVGFAAILCSIQWQKKTANRKVFSNAWIYLMLVFLGFGIIDILFKQVAAFKEMPYTTSLFIIYILAFVISLIVLIFRDLPSYQNYMAAYDVWLDTGCSQFW
jgi:hypothetical protein